MTPYRVFIAAEVIVALRKCNATEKSRITRLFDRLAENPFLPADFVEPDDIGRPIQIMIVGRFAVCFWADHAVKEVKILDLKPAGNRASFSVSKNYRLVQLAGGAHSLHSVAHGETFHPVVGPVAEAEALYVNQLRLRERLAKHPGEFVIWDVGLGAAANALTVLRATQDIAATIRLVSFDCTIEPLEFALQHAAALGYFGGYENHVGALLRNHRVEFQTEQQSVDWELHLGDFPTWLAAQAEIGNRKPEIPAPHAILFDAFSPKKNPAMWTQSLFTQIFQLLDPQRPCALPTYSRSTLLRVTLLLAGFYVGVGHATGEKEETTIAANTLDLIAEPLDKKFLQRARVSYSAEPLRDASYRQSPLTEASWAALQAHPQFRAV